MHYGNHLTTKCMNNPAKVLQVEKPLQLHETMGGKIKRSSFSHGFQHRLYDSNEQ